MKRGKLKKQSKQSISKVQRVLWELCKQIVRKKYPPVCYICGKPVAGSNDHTAHLIPKAACGAYLKYDLRNLRRCCYHDNVNLGGNGSEYYRIMVQREGQEYVDQLFQDRQKSVKAMDHYLALIETYKQELSQLTQTQ